jgi:hypothetical protein
VLSRVDLADLIDTGFVRDFCEFCSGEMRFELFGTDLVCADCRMPVGVVP